MAGILLALAGVLVLAEAVVTLVWQEPFTALSHDREQRRLDSRLAAVPPAGEEVLRGARTLRERLSAQAAALGRRQSQGEPLGRLRVPAIGVSEVFVQGTEGASLREGPGHYDHTPLPGAGGTVALAGHRTTHGAPFADLDDLHRGDSLELAMPYGRFTYAVERIRIVSAAAVSVLRRAPSDRLVLTACHPKFSAARRIVVEARPVGVDARSSTGS